MLFILYLHFVAGTQIYYGFSNGSSATIIPLWHSQVILLEFLTSGNLGFTGTLWTTGVAPTTTAMASAS
jgi:hypothetical protein